MGVWGGVYGKVRQGGEESKDGFVLCVGRDGGCGGSCWKLGLGVGPLGERDVWEGEEAGELGVAYNEVTYNCTVGANKNTIEFFFFFCNTEISPHLPTR